MPFTYEEYIANEDIQETIKGLGYDIDKFWFALLFVWDYCEGECFQALELMNDPYLDLILFPKAILEHDHENRYDYINSCTVECRHAVTIIAEAARTCGT